MTKKTKSKLSGRLFLRGLVVLSVLLFIFTITRGINLPYVGYNAWNFNTYSLIAKNYTTFGYIPTKFAPIISVAETLPKQPKYYLHHPQMISLSESVLYKAFGPDFWVGRLTVILYSFGSFVLLYFIARELKGGVYAAYTVVAASLLPAFPVFGRMINMEPLVMFFALFLVYSLQRFFKTENKLYIPLMILCVILGVFSDWPMVYLPILLLPWILLKKHLWLAAMLIVVGFASEAAFLAYIYFLLGSFADLQIAIINRSLGQLLSLPFWPIIWLATLGLRFILYYNPLFVGASLVILFQTVKRLLKKDLSDWSILLIVFFLFALFFVAFFPEGSYGHAYWIIYFIPFIALSGGLFLQTLFKKSTLAGIFLVLFSICFLLLIENWKTKEIQGNLWRYNLAEKANAYFEPYEVIPTNPDSPIDTDLFAFVFSHEVTPVPLSQIYHDNLPYSKYLFACSNACPKDDPVILSLVTSYKVTSGKSTEGEFMLFDFTKSTGQKFEQLPSAAQDSDSLSKPPSNPSLLRKWYILLKGLLHAPQL